MQEISIVKDKIFVAFETPTRAGLSWEERWKGPDRGLIGCWEIGRSIRERDPDLAARAENGELPVLDWKGGIAKATKAKKKFGTMYYFAQWLGLGGKDLDIDLSSEPVLTCARTGVSVTYTNDPKKFAGS